MEQAGRVQRLSERRCAAHEGDIIAGQYRLVQIGVESVVMEYVDGRGPDDDSAVRPGVRGQVRPE